MVAASGGRRRGYVVASGERVVHGRVDASGDMSGEVSTQHGDAAGQ